MKASSKSKDLSPRIKVTFFSYVVFNRAFYIKIKSPFSSSDLNFVSIPCTLLPDVTINPVPFTG